VCPFSNINHLLLRLIKVMSRVVSEGFQLVHAMTRTNKSAITRSAIRFWTRNEEQVLRVDLTEIRLHVVGLDGCKNFVGE